MWFCLRDELTAGTGEPPPARDQPQNLPASPPPCLLVRAGAGTLPPVAASHLVLDIETVLDPELPISPTGEVERLPAPPHHKIVVIGLLLFDPTYQVKRIAVLSEAKDESGMLQDFARYL